MYACDVLQRYDHVAVAVELAHCLHTLPRVHRSVAMLRTVVVLSVLHHALPLLSGHVVVVPYDHLHEGVIVPRQVVDAGLRFPVQGVLRGLRIFFQSVGTWCVMFRAVAMILGLHFVWEVSEFLVVLVPLSLGVHQVEVVVMLFVIVYCP